MDKLPHLVTQILNGLKAHCDNNSSVEFESVQIVITFLDWLHERPVYQDEEYVKWFIGRIEKKRLLFMAFPQDTMTKLEKVTLIHFFRLQSISFLSSVAIDNHK